MDVVLHVSRLVLLPLHGRVRQVGLLLGDLILDQLFEVVLRIPARENLLHPRYAGGLFVSTAHNGESMPSGARSISNITVVWMRELWSALRRWGSCGYELTSEVFDI